RDVGRRQRERGGRDQVLGVRAESGLRNALYAEERDLHQGAVGRIEDVSLEDAEARRVVDQHYGRGPVPLTEDRPVDARAIEARSNATEGDYDLAGDLL